MIEPGDYVCDDKAMTIRKIENVKQFIICAHYQTYLLLMLLPSFCVSSNRFLPPLTVSDPARSIKLRVDICTVPSSCSPMTPISLFSSVILYLV